MNFFSNPHYFSNADLKRLTYLWFLRSGDPLGSSCGAATILKKISISSCQDKKEIDYCSDVIKYYEKGIPAFLINFTWQAVAGETRVHLQLAQSPLFIHRGQLVTQKTRFCKTQGLNLESVMNVTEKSTNAREKPGKHVMKCVKHNLSLPSKPIVLFCLFWGQI